MKSIKFNTVWDLINKKTTPTVSTDMNIAFLRTIYSTVDKKEELGIYDPNLILSGIEFPPDPNSGQIFIKNGRPYIYKEQE